MILYRLLHNGRIYTMDSERTAVEAILIDGNRILEVGDFRQLMELAGRAEMIDLGGATVVPGLVDSHTHFLSYCSLRLGVDLTGTRTLEEVQGLIGRKADELPAGEWIRGAGWNKNLWPGGEFPGREDLDEVTQRHPVAVSSKDGHALWANSEALRRAGLDSGVSCPPGGDILRDERGDLRGIFFETARSLVEDAMPPARLDELKDVVLQGQREAHALGLTGLVSCEGADALRVFGELNREGALSLRIRMTIPAESLDAAEKLGLTGFLGDEYLRITAVKIFVDGAIGSQTAHLFSAYCGRDDGYRGVEVCDRRDLRSRVRRAFALSLPVAVHAIGDAANHKVLDVLEELGAPDLGLRNRIEHAQLLLPGDIDRFARLGVIASVQPAHAVADRDLVDQYWGTRGRWAYAFRSLLDAGAVLAFGSDLPVDALDPLVGIRSAVTRRADDSRESWYPEERLTPAEAVCAYTWGSAYAVNEEDRRGRIAPGMLADLTVFDSDIIAGAPTDECSVLATVVGGEVVYGEGNLVEDADPGDHAG
ncbi:MAG: amidohydrolase [Bacillota bacterium]